MRPRTEVQIVLSPGLREAPVLDCMCSQFVLALTLRNAARFNLRRDWASLLSFTGRHLVWPLPVLHRLREFLGRRCQGNEHWRGHEALSDDAFMQRHGPWRGPYEEGTLFFYIDEYVKDAPKDLLAVLGVTADWLARRLKKESTLVQKNIDALAGLLQLNAAERALLLYGTLARYQRELRGLLVEFKVGSARSAGFNCSSPASASIFFCTSVDSFFRLRASQSAVAPSTASRSLGASLTNSSM